MGIVEWYAMTGAIVLALFVNMIVTASNHEKRIRQLESAKPRRNMRNRNV